MKCPYCQGKGFTEQITNPAYHYEPFEDPCIEEQGCDECGGTGEIDDSIIEEENRLITDLDNIFYDDINNPMD